MVKANTTIFLFALVFVAGLAVLALFFFYSNPNAVLVEGVLISADNESPLIAFPELAESSTFVVSPQFYEPVVSLDSYMFNGAALFIQVLEGNNKNAVQLIRVYNNENQLTHCLTNYGDVSRQETLGLDECNAMQQPGQNTIVLIQFPDNTLPQPEIELREKQITVKPKSYEDIGSTCFLALRIMYKNAQDIVDASNILVSRISP